MGIAVVMPLGPGSQEVARARDTVESLRTWEPEVRWIVLVNDSPEPRKLDIAGATVLAHPVSSGKGHPYARIASATLAGFSWARAAGADIVMKLDADALVIAPFASKLEVALADRSVGLVGSYDRTCNGQPRDFGPWVRPTVRAAAHSLRFAQMLGAACLHGYRLGEHALGAAIAVPRRALVRMPLDDPTAFIGTRLGDDPLLGLLIRRAGFRLANATDDLFALAWRGLPDTPDRLLERGFSIIHSVKNDEAISEADIRQFFAKERRTV